MSESLGRRRLFGVFVCVSVGIRLGRLGDARGVRLLRPRVFARLERGVTFVPSVPQSAEEPRQGLRRRAVGVGPGEILRSRRRGVELAQLGAQLSEPGAGPGVGRIQRHGGHARSNRLREESPPLPRERGGSVGVHGRDRGVGRDGLIVRGDRVGELPALVKGVAALLRSLGHLPRLRSGAGDRLVYDTRRVHSTSRRWTCAGRRFQKRSFFADFHDERPTHALLLLVPPVEHVSPATIDGGAERTIVISGWSKTWAMTGMRVGFLAGPNPVVKAALKCQANSASHIPTFMMEAARVALDCDDEVEEFSEAYRKRRDLMIDGLSDIPGLRIVDPEGAFYLFVDVTETGMTDIEFADGALDAGVQLIPASLITGGEGFVRISYAAPEADINEGISRIRGWLLDDA